MPTITDLLSNTSSGARPTSTNVNLARNTGITTLQCADLTGWPTDSPVHFVTYKLDSQGKVTSQTDWKGLVSGNIINNLTVTGGSDTGNAVGDYVEMLPTARYGRELYQALSAHTNVDGTLKTSAVQAALNIQTTSSPDWTILSTVPTLNASNGQREYQLKFSGVDYTDRLQPGTKIKIPRTSTAPTQSSSFVAASSQYASKASPAGMAAAWTAFTIENWVNLTSYTNNWQYLPNRFDSSGTSGGWAMRINLSGQVSLFYGTGSSYTEWVTYQSVPLNRDVHVAGVVTSTSAKTALIYIDGISVPINQVTSAATALTQPAVDFRIGAAAATPANTYLNGAVSEARVWSVAQTAQQIRDNMNKQLIGNETNLVAYYKLNGNFNDSTANANNLTASGGAIATNASNPMKATEYAIVTAVTKPAADTLVTVFTPTGTGIPNETLGTVSYSSARAPYGFPAARNEWLVQSIYRSDMNQGTPTTNTWYNVGLEGLIIPTGKWMAGYVTTSGADRAAAGRTDSQVTFSTTNNSEVESRFTSSQGAGGVTFSTSAMKVSEPLAISSQTQYYLLARTAQTTITNVYFFGGSSFSPTIITAECAYL